MSNHPNFRRNQPALWLSGFVVATAIALSSLSMSLSLSKTLHAQEVDPATLSDPYAKKLLVDAYEKSRQVKKADDLTSVIESCERALAERLVEKDQAYARNLLSWSYNRLGELYAEQAAAQAQQGRHRQANEFDTLALEQFEAAVKNDPKSWKAFHNRGVSYALHGKLDEALEDFNRVLSLDPTYLNAWYNRAEVLSEQNRFDEAVDDYTHALARKSDDTLSLSGRAAAYIALKKYQEAARDIERVLQLEPQNVDMRCIRADVHQGLHQWDFSASEYQQIIKLKPEHSAAYRGAAWLMATCPEERFRNDELAVKTAEKALSLAKTDRYSAFQVLAAAQANSGRFDQAVESQKQAIEACPERLRDEFQSQLELYKGGKPFRQP